MVKGTDVPDVLGDRGRAHPPMAKKAANRARNEPYCWRRPRSDVEQGSIHKQERDTRWPNLAKWRHAVAYFRRVVVALLACIRVAHRESMVDTSVGDRARGRLLSRAQLWQNRDLRGCSLRQRHTLRHHVHCCSGRSTRHEGHIPAEAASRTAAEGMTAAQPSTGQRDTALPTDFLVRRSWIPQREGHPVEATPDTSPVEWLVCGPATANETGQPQTSHPSQVSTASQPRCWPWWRCKR